MTNPSRSHDPRAALALAEHTRLTREIEDLERSSLDASGRGLLAALRMCRAHIEGELRRRGVTPHRARPVRRCAPPSP